MTLTVSRRSLASLAAAGAAAPILASCTGDHRPVSSSPAYVAGSAELEVELAPEVDGVQYPESYDGPRARQRTRLTEEDAEFRIVVPAAPDVDMATNAHSRWLEETTGVRIVFETLPPGDDARPALTGMIASGNMPDAFMLGASMFSPSEIALYGEQGVFQGLGEHIDRWAPNLLETFSRMSNARALATAPDGDIYAFPSIGQCYHCSGGPTRLWIRGGLLSSIGLEEPRTIEEFESMLETIHGTGAQTGVTTTLTGERDTPPLAYFYSCFDNPGNDWLRRESGAVIHAGSDDAMRTTLALLRGWVEKGWLDPAAFTQDADQRDRLIGDTAHSPVAITSGWLPGEDPWTDFVAMAPVSAGDVDPVLPWDYWRAVDQNLMITSSCADPQLLVRWADAQMDLIGTTSARMGPPELGFSWSAEGELGIDGRQAIYTRTPQENGANLGWQDWGPYNQGLDLRNAERVDPAHRGLEATLYDATKLFEPYRMPEEATVYPGIFDTSQAAEVAEFETNIEAIRVRHIAQFIAGAADVSADSDWQTYQDELEAAGLSRYLELRELGMQTRGL
ncbi:hypothetical protein [Brachybacterium hainanense]|uniref:ABC transporter substrate-binding protein n=1 Tax=Brachybacterium hainanense TaxID=1541174 RepID=A0ABV6RDR9_9MICO